MKLADFFARVEPFLLGKMSHPDVVARLFGPTPQQPDADRLAIYGRFCEVHRHEVLDGIFLYLREMVVRVGGEDGWNRLVRAYFDQHPMYHFELNHNAVHVPKFVLSIDAEALGFALPEFAPDLADFEWWEWQTQSAPDDESELSIDEGPLRLHGSVELRPYAYDLLSWINSAEDPASLPSTPPEKKDSLVLFWRDRSLSLRRDRVSPLEIQIIKAVCENLRLDRELAAVVGVAFDELAETAQDLHQAGIVIGDPQFLPGATT